MKTIIISFIFILFLFISCQKNLEQPSDTPPQSQGKLTMQIDMTNAPAEVSYLKGFLARAEYDTIFFDFSISNGIAHASIKDIEKGEWYLQVDAFDENGKKIYSGSVYVFVEGGKTTPVFLNLEKILGDIDITVSWEGVPRNFMLLMAQNEFGVWHILLMTADGSKIFDLIDGRYPIWTNDQRNQFLFLRNRDELCQFDLSTHRVTYLTSLGVNANFLFYSRSLNRILFDYKYFDNSSQYWHLASVNPTGEDFQNILSDAYWEKYPITTSGSDWIYYHTMREGIEKIFRVKPDGTQNQAFINGNFHSEFPAFDIEGQRMVFTKMSLDSTYMSVVIHDMNSGQQQEFDVTELGEPTYPTFTVDGQAIIYSSIVGPAHRDRQLFRINLVNKQIDQITHGHKYFWYARPVFW